jgi:hypothetical protein
MNTSLVNWIQEPQIKKGILPWEYGQEVEGSGAYARAYVHRRWDVEGSFEVPWVVLGMHAYPTAMQMYQEILFNSIA